MSPEFEFERRSFILKIWLEEVETSARGARWRGHITQVETGEKRYVECLRDISTFLQAHLAVIGVHMETPETGDPR